MWAHGQLPHEAAVVVGVPRVGPRSPEDRTAKSALEVLDGLHRDGVGHLLVKLRVAFGRSPAVLREQARVVEVYRLVGLAARVLVLDRKVLAYGAFADEVLPTYFKHHLVYARRFESRREARVNLVDAHAPVGRVPERGLVVAGWWCLGHNHLRLLVVRRGAPRGQRVSRGDVLAQRERGPVVLYDRLHDSSQLIALELARGGWVWDELLQPFVEQPALRDLQVGCAPSRGWAT